MSNKIELKPCPFCGADAALYVDDGVCVICQNCGAKSATRKDMLGSHGVVGNATASVIYKWNQRAFGNMDTPEEVTEVCPHCENEITLHWNVKNRGYKAYCPVCGKRLMLCFTCHSNEYRCDYDCKTDECRWNLAKEDYKFIKKDSGLSE